MVVLLVEQVAVARGTFDVVHAEPGVPVGGRRRMGVALTGGGVRQVVAPLPGHPTVLGGEDAGGRDPDPHPLRILGVGDDRVQDEPRGAGPPLGGRRVVAQALDRLPRHAVVVADQQGRRLGPRVEPAPTRPSDHTCEKPSPNGVGASVQPMDSANAGSSAAQASI